MKLLKRSFAGGEVTPEMHGRIDLTKYQTGLGLSRNFIVLPHGPVARRPGFEYIQQCLPSEKVRLIPFAYSADQAVVIEFGHLYARFHTKDGSVLEATKAITGIAGDVVTIPGHGYSAGDWVFVGAGFFAIKSVTNANVVVMEGIRGEVAAPVGATAARVYKIATPYEWFDLFDITYSQDSDVLTLCHIRHAARELRRLGATNWQMAAVSFAPSIGWPASISATATQPTAGTGVNHEYAVTSIAADGITESLRSGGAVAVNALNLVGNYNDVNWSAVAGATRYYVYKKRGGVWGFIGQTTDLTLRDDNILPDTTRTPPEDIIKLNTVAGEFPSAVTHFEQRRWFGGTRNKPQNIWATRSATQSNLTSSVPGRDDDAMEFRIAARQQNAIRHLVTLGDILALTAGGEWRIYSDGSAITFSTLMVKPQGYAGASNVQPIVTSGSVLYVQAQGSRLRELSYNWEVNSYRTIDLSIMAPHLLNGYKINELAYSRSPDQIMWAVRDDGKLLSMTYVPDQQVYAWSQHDTPGQFESCCVIPEGSDDALYVVVRRLVLGTWRRYIERLKSRIFSDQKDAYFVDSGMTYSGTPVTTISGIWHLNGETVDVLADGATEVQQKVVNGSITLQYPASKVHVGLPIISDMATLPLAVEGAQAFGQGTLKNVVKAAFRIHASSVLKVGPDFGHLTENRARDVADPYGSPPALKSAEVEIRLTPSWGTDGIVCIRQDQPLPLTVASMTLEVASGG